MMCQSHSAGSSRCRGEARRIIMALVIGVMYLPKYNTFNYCGNMQVIIIVLAIIVIIAVLHKSLSVLNHYCSTQNHCDSIKNKIS